MDHGDHGGHGMGPKCSMNMLWNTDIIDTCIIFPQWHISSTFSFVVSFFAIVGLGILYEYLREIQKNVDRQIAASLRNHGIESPIRGATGRQGTTSPEGISEVEDAGLLTGRRTSKKTEGVPLTLTARAIRAVLYGVSVFLSFFLMLVFMTYNAYLILAVVVGAALGHFIFGAYLDVDGVLAGSAGGRSMACH